MVIFFVLLMVMMSCFLCLKAISKDVRLLLWSAIINILFLVAQILEDETYGLTITFTKAEI